MNNTFVTISDIGSIAIASDIFVMYIRNYMGDGENIVNIGPPPEKILKDNASFMGVFKVKKDEAVFLSNYDCEIEPIYTFELGRYFVYLDRNADTPTFYISKNNQK